MNLKTLNINAIFYPLLCLFGFHLRSDLTSVHSLVECSFFHNSEFV